MTRFGVLASGSGTNLAALLDRLNGAEGSPGRIAVVLSDRADAYALERARRGHRQRTRSRDSTSC